MSNSNCCFLTCIQISQETGKVVWHSHLFQNFPQFVVIYTVKGFDIVNKAEVDGFSGTLLLLNDPMYVGNLISGSSAFSKSSLNICKFSFYISWSLAWKILSITLLACEMSATVWYFEHSLALSFFWIGMKTDLTSGIGYGPVSALISCENFKVTTRCWITIDRRMSDPTRKRYPTSKGKGEAPARC